MAPRVAAPVGFGVGSAVSELASLDAAGRAALGRFGIESDARLDLLSYSENAVYLVTRADGSHLVMRVHRTGYHTPNGVRSELAWMTALQRDAGVQTPQAIPGLDSEQLQLVQVDSATEPRMVVLFDFIPGVEPEVEDTVEAFHELGAISARMHDHARSWVRPAYFERQVWDYEHSFGVVGEPNWGRWQDGFGAHCSGMDTVERADELMRSRLEAFGKSRDRYGLIHSDLRHANLLIENGETKVLDFDDMGIGWYVYDVASSVTFHENHPDVERMIEAWIRGYRTVGDLSAAEIAEIPTFMMLRRLIIMGWAGSHAETELAREMGDAYTDGTVEFARTYLAKAGAP